VIKDLRLWNLIADQRPVLNGFAITLELPNEGSKLDFEKEMALGHLKDIYTIMILLSKLM
jgi:hypothetical protein